MTDTGQAIAALEKWRKEGAACRDAPRGVNPYGPETLAYYMHCQGWIQRDFQLCLARANPSYRQQQLQAGNITLTGIEGGYGFPPSSPLVGAIR